MSPRVPVTLTAKALLFDMDGTLVESTAAIEGAWATYGQRYPHLDIPSILKTAHGIRSVDNMRRHVLPPGTPEAECEVSCHSAPPRSLHPIHPGLLPYPPGPPIPSSNSNRPDFYHPGRSQAEADRFEIEIVASAKRAKDLGKHGIVYLPGTESILAVARAAKPPAPRLAWAICTSATPVYAASALQTVGIPVPAAFVTARDVPRGKPFPDPYLQGAEKCSVDPKDCVVFEDAPSGIRSGKAAGCKVIALLTSHSREAVEAAEPDVIVQDLSHVVATWDGDLFILQIV